MNEGWVKAHRAVLDDPIISKDAEHLAIWMWLLMNATHKQYFVWFKKEKKALNEGQLITGRKKIADELKVSESKVQRVLKLFTDEGLIEQETSNKNRIITIVGWSTYQGSREEPTTEPLGGGGQENITSKVGNKPVRLPEKPRIYYSKSEQQANGKRRQHPAPPVEYTATASDARLRKASEATASLGEVASNMAPTERLERTPPEQQVNTEQECKNKEYNTNKLEKGEGGKVAKKATAVERFVPPSLEEVERYVQEKGLNVRPKVWHSYYESNGWHVGRSKMKSWTSSLITWHEREKSPSGGSNRGATRFQPNLKVNEFWENRADRYAARLEARRQAGY